MSTKSITQILEFLDNRGIPEQEVHTNSITLWNVNHGLQNWELQHL
jgi:hypothetical protein